MGFFVSLSALARSLYRTSSLTCLVLDRVEDRMLECIAIIELEVGNLIVEM